ncbi:MAG: hypothetical protein LBD13_00440 [Spirochaetaceae bacterium]|jgi:hypothetical protein|nr:hypothetical protein [Spirochaetaceae bacterium]
MWYPFKPKIMTWYRWRLNGGAAYLRKTGSKNWETGFSAAPLCARTDDCGGPEEAAPPDIPLTRVWGSGETAVLRPCLSGTPYLLKLAPRESVKIAPEQEAAFTLLLPPAVRLETDGPFTLGEAMPLAPKQTWFGPDTMSGHFCHLVTGGLAPETAEAEPPAPSCCIRGGLRVRNRSKTPFALERFVLYPPPLSVYAKGGLLAADPVDIEFYGPDMDEKTIVRDLGDASYRLVSAGVKTGAGETFARQSMDIIKHITQF